MPDPTDTLHQMREQVDAAYQSAERLVREAEAAARERVRELPPRGFAEPAAPEGAGSDGSTAVEALQAILGLLEVVRRQVPPELAQQFAGAARELLVAVRALIDWYLERLDRPPPSPRTVEDIPID